jgi:geranylgeranyl pyrophosphate synthase
MALIDYPPFKAAHEKLHKVWSKTGNLSRCGSKCLICGAEYNKEDWKALEKAIEDLGRIAQAYDGDPK